MKTIVFKLFLLLLIVSSCEKVAPKTIKEPVQGPVKLAVNEFRINGTILNNDITSIYLYEVENDSLIAIDTSSVKLNNFSFVGKLNAPKYFALKTNKTESTTYFFIADDSEMDVILNDLLATSSVSSSSDTQQDLKGYYADLKEFDKEELELLLIFKKDITNETSATFKTDLERVIKDRQEFIFNYISSNNASETSPLILRDNIETFSFSSLQILQDTLSESLQKLAFVKDLKIQIAGMEEEKIEVIELKLERNKVRVYRTNARAINGATPSGSVISLNSIPRGKVVLVDFWASWCGPCRMTNPKLVYLHNKYKDKGLVILSVSEDKDTGKWISAIAKDNLIWNTHVLDKNGLIASSYGVDAIPHKVLIDKQGRIADWKISGSKLEKRIQELLIE